MLCWVMNRSLLAPRNMDPTGDKMALHCRDLSSFPRSCPLAHAHLAMNNAIALVSFVLVAVVYLALRPRSTIRNIRGPPSPSWIFGHMLQLWLSPCYGDHEFTWLKYGSVYRINGCFGENRLMVSDPQALHHILHSSNFGKSPFNEGMTRLVCGDKSVIAVKGDEHRRLRAALNIGFTAAAVRKYMPVFEKAAETISEQFEIRLADGDTRIDVCPLLSSVTLGAISEAILGSSIEDLGEDFVTNNARIVELSAAQTGSSILANAIAARLPPWCWRLMMHLPTTAFRIIRKERVLADRIGRRLFKQKMDAVRKGVETNNEDLFGLLVHPEARRKVLSEDDIVAQTVVILIAGQESTANSVAFGLLELARHRDFQDKLRAEVHSTAEESDGTKQLPYDSMPLLNAFIKETLRLYPVTPFSERVALEDTVIPLAEPITTSTGQRLNEIPVERGRVVTVAVASYQRLSARWGPDPNEFNPSRWLEGKPYQGDAVGPYANLLSFLGGPRTCLGWRFAILEMQVVVCELIAKFSFAEPEHESVQPRFLHALMPVNVKGERALPLCIKRIS
ncbi:cytochrome P450 [Mycena capillaripes]|nr:cytochrome P450 [Mycena capillaripes]